MKIRVCYFALLREAVGMDSELVDWEGSPPTLEKLKEFLSGRYSVLGPILQERPLLYAVNQEYADGGTRLRDGDEVALFPPVSGG